MAKVGRRQSRSWPKYEKLLAKSGRGQSRSRFLCVCAESETFSFIRLVKKNAQQSSMYYTHTFVPGHSEQEVTNVWEYLCSQCCSDCVNVSTANVSNDVLHAACAIVTTLHVSEFCQSRGHVHLRFNECRPEKFFWIFHCISSLFSFCRHVLGPNRNAEAAFPGSGGSCYAPCRTEGGAV